MDLVESYRQDLRFARKGITKGLLALLIGALLTTMAIGVIGRKVG